MSRFKSTHIVLHFTYRNVILKCYRLETISPKNLQCLLLSYVTKFNFHPSSSLKNKICGWTNTATVPAVSTVYTQ